MMQHTLSYLVPSAMTKEQEVAMLVLNTQPVIYAGDKGGIRTVWLCAIGTENSRRFEGSWQETLLHTCWGVQCLGHMGLPKLLPGAHRPEYWSTIHRHCHGMRSGHIQEMHNEYAYKVS